MITITVAVPPGLIAAMNALAAELTDDPTNATIWGSMIFVSGSGALYSAASWSARDEWAAAALAAMAAAEIPHVVWSGDGPPPAAVPGRVTIYLGPTGVDALAAMGLTVVDGGL